MANKMTQGWPLVTSSPPWLAKFGDLAPPRRCTRDSGGAFPLEMTRYANDPASVDPTSIEDDSDHQDEDSPFFFDYQQYYASSTSTLRDINNTITPGATMHLVNQNRKGVTYDVDMFVFDSDFEVDINTTTKDEIRTTTEGIRGRKREVPTSKRQASPAVVKPGKAQRRRSDSPKDKTRQRKSSRATGDDRVEVNTAAATMDLITVSPSHLQRNDRRTHSPDDERIASSSSLTPQNSQTRSQTSLSPQLSRPSILRKSRSEAAASSHLPVDTLLYPVPRLPSALTAISTGERDALSASTVSPKTRRRLSFALDPLPAAQPRARRSPPTSPSTERSAEVARRTQGSTSQGQLQPRHLARGFSPSTNGRANAPTSPTTTTALRRQSVDEFTTSTLPRFGSRRNRASSFSSLGESSTPGRISMLTPTASQATVTLCKVCAVAHPIGFKPSTKATNSTTTSTTTSKATSPSSTRLHSSDTLTPASRRLSLPLFGELLLAATTRNSSTSSYFSTSSSTSSSNSTLISATINTKTLTKVKAGSTPRRGRSESDTRALLESLQATGNYF